MRINFDFGDLEAFLDVAEQGSFQRAAERLHISQSAITRRIQKLESSLGIRLFERTTRSLKLTLDGKVFLPRAQGMLDDAAEALRALRDDSSRLEQQRNAIITIAVIPTATHQLLPQVIKQFRDQGHTSRINILDLFANDVTEVVAQGEADFGISFIGTQEPGLEFENLIEDRFVLAMHRDHPLSSHKQIKWQIIRGQPMVVPWKGTGNRMLIDNEIARHHLNLDWTYQVHHSSTALGLVEAGVAIAVLPQSAVPARNDSMVISRPLIDPEIIRVIGTVRRTGQRLSVSAKAFYGLLIEHCKD